MKPLRKKIVKMGIVIRQNRRMISIICLWFLLNFILLWINSADLIKALQLLIYIEDPTNRYQKFYLTYSDYVVFGLLIGLITVDALRDYNPSETSQILSSKLKNHVIILGYNHLGIRLHRYFIHNGEPHTIVSRFPGRLNELFSSEEPAVFYDELDREFPKKVALIRAKLLILTENDTVFNLQMVVLSRKFNPKMKIIVRCFDDSISKVFKGYDCQVISQSSATAKRLLDTYANDGIKTIHVIGFNHFAERVSFMAIPKDRKITIIEHRDGAVEDMEEFNSKLKGKPRDLITIVKGNPMDYKLLEEVGTNKADMVIITLEADEDVIVLAKELKEINPRCTVIARAFSDELGKILTNFGCVAVSTSVNAFETQVKPFLDEINENIEKGKKRKERK